MSQIIIDQDIEQDIINAWLNGYNDDSAGNVEFSYGHYIYHEIDGRLYAVWTDSLGNTQLIVFMGEDEMNAHKDMINGLDDTTDSEL